MKRKLQSVILTMMFTFSVAGFAFSGDGFEDYHFKGDCISTGCHCHYFQAQKGSWRCICGHMDFMHKK